MGSLSGKNLSEGNIEGMLGKFCLINVTLVIGLVQLFC